MAGLPTIEMFKGEKRLICNEADEAQFAADGWGREKPPTAAEAKAKAEAEAKAKAKTK